MYEHVNLVRDVAAIQIPDGTRLLLAEATRVIITQELGGSFTVMTERGAMYRIDERDGDALGKDVPEAPQSSGCSGIANFPPTPRTSRSVRVSSTSTPSRASAWIMARVSSESSQPVNRLSPWARAAQTRARFVKLFDPGTETVASGTPMG